MPKLYKYRVPRLSLNFEGDHKFIFIELNFFAPLNVSTFYRREWSHYDQYLINDKMKHELLLLNNVIEDGLTVNELWNLLLVALFF